MIIDANLDIEARWAGRALPAAVAKRVSLYGALTAALAPAAPDTELWLPAAIDPRRIVGLPAATYRVGRPPRADVRWADDTPPAKAANDRRLVHALGLALPGACVVGAGVGVGPRNGSNTIGGAAAELDTILDEKRAMTLENFGVGPRNESLTFVAKAPWTAAGRDRIRWTGTLAPDQRTYVERLIARQGAVVVEPWCDRILDVGICAFVGHGAARPEGFADVGDGIVAAPPHGLVVDARGGFVGIDLAPPPLEAAEQAALSAAVRTVGAALAQLGYAGPFALDAFAYRVGEERRFHAVCEINARHTFGFVARALRVVRRLMLAGTPPAGARVLIAPGDDGACAWVE